MDGNIIEIEIAVTDALERAKEQIQANMASKGINASGRTSKSFRVERYDGGVRLVMGGTGQRTAPLQTLEVGRPPGNVPGGFVTTKAGVRDVSKTFKWILIQWAKEKGLGDIGWGAATMMGRKIAEQGTNRHSHPEDVYSSVVLETADTVAKDAVKAITIHIHEQLTR